MAYTYVMYYSVIKRNRVLIYATVWMNLENMVNERQTKGYMYDSFYLKYPRIGKSIQTQNLG